MTFDQAIHREFKETAKPATNYAEHAFGEVWTAQMKAIATPGKAAEEGSPAELVVTKIEGYDAQAGAQKEMCPAKKT